MGLINKHVAALGPKQNFINSAMAFQSAFRERLREMEITRNQRLSLLQTEKDLQTNKSQLLSAKLAQIRSLEQRCLLLDNKFASHNFKISSLKSEIEFLERKYENFAQQLRVLRVEVEDLERLEEERENCYALKRSEMQEFKDRADNFASQIRCQVQELRRRRDELKSSYLELLKQKNPDIQAAEMRKTELLALKEKVTSSMESNSGLRDELQKQLQSLR